MVKDVDYKGYIISVDKEVGLTSYSVFRKEDMWEIISDFTEGSDRITSIIKDLKGRVDEFILTEGESEYLGAEF